MADTRVRGDRPLRMGAPVLGSLANLAPRLVDESGPTPEGPGAESTANWMTSSLASWVRLALLHATGHAPLWPMTIIPLLGLALTVLYLAIVRPSITWPEQIHPVLCLSVGLRPTAGRSTTRCWFSARSCW